MGRHPPTEGVKGRAVAAPPFRSPERNLREDRAWRPPPRAPGRAVNHETVEIACSLAQVVRQGAGDQGWREAMAELHPADSSVHASSIAVDTSQRSRCSSLRREWDSKGVASAAHALRKAGNEMNARAVRRSVGRGHITPIGGSTVAFYGSTYTLRGRTGA